MTATLVSPQGTPSPSTRRRIGNFVVFQAAWLAAIFGAAHQMPLLGTEVVLVAIGWHLFVSARPAVEAKLVALVCVIGFVVDSLAAMQGHLAYPSGQPDPRLAPYWIVALWGLLAITLNVTLRWLKPHLVLAAAIGAVAGPASLASGVRLGGAQFIDATPALIFSAVTWAAALPLLMWLSNRFDGVADLADHAE